MYNRTEKLDFRKTEMVIVVVLPRLSYTNVPEESTIRVAFERVEVIVVQRIRITRVKKLP